MRYKKILLVAPRFNKGKHTLSILPQAGLGYIAEALKTAGFTVAVFDMNLKYTLEQLDLKIREFTPDLIGFTAMTFGFDELYSTIDRVKSAYPEINIAAGGPHISTFREQVLQDCKGLDFAFVLEGDRSIVELCQGNDFSTIQGLIFREGTGLVSVPFKDFLGNLNELPFPKYELFELDKYPVKQIGIVTSRGCPYDCIYCPVITAIGKKFRSRSADNVVAEIEYWYNRGYRELLILDDNFTLIRKRTEEICALLIRKNFGGLILKCPNGIRADKVDRELLLLMRQAGFNMLAFGVEAGTDKVLKNIKKGEGIELIEQRIKEATELGFDVDLFFLIGSPGETLDDFKQSLELASRYPVRNANFYNLIPFPTTELYDWIKANDYLLLPIEEIMTNASHFINNPCYYTPEMSAEERKKAFIMGKLVSREARRRFIERKLRIPFIVRRGFSWLYTEPFFERMLFNNPIVIRAKEIVKKMFLSNRNS